MSGALFPLSNLPRGLAIATRLDPLTYGIDGLRGAFIGISYFGIGLNVSVLCGVWVIFLGLGARAFARIQV
jgi:ABC-2 type transport system permease protein